MPPHDASSAGLSLADALAEVARLVAFEAADCPTSQQAEVVLALRQLSDRLDAELAVWLGAFDAQHGWMHDGARSAGSWLAARSDVSRRTAAALTHQARDLRACPHVAQAHRSGRIGTAKVRALLRAREVYPDLFREHEEGLVDAIAGLTTAQAEIVCARWADKAQATRDAEQRAAGEDPHAVPPEPPKDPAAANTFHLSKTLEGRVVGSFDLDAAAGAVVANAIGGHLDHAHRSGQIGPEDDRTPGHRRADAFVDLVHRGSHAGSHHGTPRPSVVAHIDAATLAGIPADSLEDGLARRCHLADGTPIHISTAERLLCTARVTAVLTKLGRDGDVEIVGITDDLRHATARQRAALAQRDKGCVFPGCGVTPDWCHAHHLIPDEIGGPTLLHNLALVCSHHHHLIHEGGWRLWRTPDGLLHLRRPDGSPVPMTPHGEVHHDHLPVPEPQHEPPPYPRQVIFRRGHRQDDAAHQTVQRT